MKARDFRIGNLGQNHDGTILKVIELREKYIGTQVIDRSKFPLPEGWQLEPIPLSEEWLEKFEFEESSLINGFFLNNTIFEKAVHIKKHPTNPGYMVFTKGVILNTLQYVHQLQNLFHALTGEELTLKTATASTTPQQTQ